MEWKAKIIDKSRADVNGSIEIIYQIFNDDTIAYDNMHITVKPSELEDVIKRKMLELKEAQEQADLIEVPQEIILV